MTGPRTAGGETVLARGPEAAVALLFVAAGALVVFDSLRVGTGWADDGPRSGTFPFYIGCALVGSGGWVLVRTLLAWRREVAAFAERSQLAQVLAVAAPMALYVAAIFPLGIYVASALLVGGFMRGFGRYRWGPTVAVAAGVPLVLFAVFERWFLVPLPKGPLERLLGF